MRWCILRSSTRPLRRRTKPAQAPRTRAPLIPPRRASLRDWRRTAISRSLAAPPWVAVLRRRWPWYLPGKVAACLVSPRGATVARVAVAAGHAVVAATCCGNPRFRPASATHARPTGKIPASGRTHGQRHRLAERYPVGHRLRNHRCAPDSPVRMAAGPRHPRRFRTCRRRRRHQIRSPRRSTPAGPRACFLRCREQRQNR
mmetsp:Transcript_47891/g.133504  ORF Transcript_47891/g.133504 Transcript_47891/m.133504 type:complete len:201 (+) Transcript_47891:1201-1803(+)